MFEARLEEGGIFKKIVDAIKELVKSANLDINTGGISLQAMDSSHVALVCLKLQEDGFKRYRCDKGLTMGLSIENLSKILKCAGNDDIITLKTEEEEPQQLGLVFESKTRERLSEFQINLMSLDTEQLGIPEQEYSSIITLPSQEFTKICRELSQISEALIIQTSKDKVTFSVSGDIGAGSINMKSNDHEKKEEQVVCEVDEPVNLSFAVRYLNLFNKASPLSNQVKLYLNQDSPLCVEYQIEKLGALKFYLAPKISDEEAQ